MIRQNLLDTHTLLLFLEGSKALSNKAREEIEAESASVKRHDTADRHELKQRKK